jgi:hypothetical protein
VHSDFIEYWTAARLLIQQGNPYSPAELLAAQRALGWMEDEALMMWNPPWTLSFLLAFGLLDYETSQLAWFLSHVLILFLGGQVLWKSSGGSPSQTSYPVLSVLSFAPAYFALLIGQIGPFVLLGLVGFLFGAKRKAWGLAGASLTLAAIKPHLVYLLWPALVLWTCREKNWRLAISFVASGVFLAIVPLLFDRHVYLNYVALLQSGAATRPLEWATPALGTALAQLFSIPGQWIRWLPGFLGLLWFLWYWSRHRGHWDWLAELPLLVTVSAATTSFAWTFDYVILLVAVVQVAAWISVSQPREAKAAIIAIHLALALMLVTLKFFVRNDFWYFWTAPSYLLLYLYARATIGAQASPRLLSR